MKFSILCLCCLWLSTKPNSAYLVEWDQEGADHVNKRRALGPQIEQNAELGILLDKYMAVGMPDIIGWLEPQALLVIRVIASIQNEMAIEGGVAEIGVHHGKFFAALCLLNADSSTPGVAVAIDVFEDQQFNIDGSGEGDQTIFNETLQKWCGGDHMQPERLQIIQADSRQLTAKDVLARSNGKGFRIFSVDGSHTAEATLTDLKTAAGALAPGGVIVVDDYFAEGWPGVSEGTQTFLRGQSATGGRQLVPFLIAFNKVLLAEEERAGEYLGAVATRRDVIGDETMKEVLREMLGHPVLVLSEEVRCRKASRTLLPGECTPDGRCAPRPDPARLP